MSRIPRRRRAAARHDADETTPAPPLQAPLENPVDGRNRADRRARGDIKRRRRPREGGLPRRFTEGRTLTAGPHYALYAAANNHRKANR